MSEIGQRIANLTPEQRALLEKRLGGGVVSRAQEPIAIIGGACRFPGNANDLDSYWQLLRNGVDGITEVPAERWDANALFDADPTAAGKITSRWGGFIANADQFDAAYFGVSPREAAEMDPQQRILMEVASEALETAGLPLSDIAGSNMGVFVGVHGHASDYLLLQNENLAELDGFSGTGAAHNLLAGRLSYLFDTHGPAMVIDTACSSSLVAVHLAVQSLRSGESSMAIAAGVNLILTPSFTIAASRMHMLAPDGRCKAFDQRADGFVRSEGCGVVVLRKLSDALANNDSIIAVIRGSAINQDGHTNGITAPNGLAQRRVVERALSDAGVAAESIGFVEAHGTGTSLGDPIELEALAANVGKIHPTSGNCYVGSAKTNIGHLEGAAGVAGLLKAALIVHHGEIAPNLHFTGLNPHIRTQGTRFRFPTTVEKWSSAQGPRRAGVSSFGWSGTNAHVILEEAPSTARNATSRTHDVRLLPLSASSADSFKALAARYHELLSGIDAPDIDDLCYSASTRRTHREFRAAVTGTSISELASALDAAVSDSATATRAARAPQSVFVFPGHGSQWAGMGQRLLEREPVFREAMVRCDAAIRAVAGWSLLEVLGAPEQSSRLHEVEVAQPALFAFGVALADLWRSWGITPSAVIGHSMGEVAAAHVAGAISLEDAATIICRRSKLLQQVAARGGMLVVELSAGEARAAVAEFEGRISVAAINGPRSTVIAGDRDALETLAVTLSSQDVFCRIVKGSPAGHSHHVDELKATLLRELARVKPMAATVPIYSTVAAVAVSGSELGAEYWVRNLREPVRFLDTMRALVADGHDAVIEMSPHPILSSVIRDIVGSGDVVVLPSLRRDEDDHEVLLDSIARMYERGADVKWARIMPIRSVVQLPTYVWQHERYWLERTRSAPIAIAPSSHAVQGVQLSVSELSQSTSDVTSWLYQAEWQLAPLSAATDSAASLSPTSAGSWIIVADRDGTSSQLADALSSTLRESDGVAHVIHTGSDFARDLDAARLTTTAWSGVVHCAGLDATPSSTLSAVSVVANPIPGIDSLLTAVRSLDSGEWSGDPRLWIVTQGASVVPAAVRNDIRVAQASLRGFARVLEAEMPGTFASGVDLDPSSSASEQASMLSRELTQGGNEPAVAFRADERFVERLVPLSAPVKRVVACRSDSSYLVTGGLSGVGLAIAEWLITQGARRLIVLGRTELPARSGWHELGDDSAAGDVVARVNAIRKLESLGASVHYYAVDVSSEPAVKKVLDTWHAEARPPIHGVVHAAGVLDDQLIANLTPQSIGAVFSAKSVGALVLASTVVQAEWFVFCSSLASMWPAPGQASYAAANAFVDALAHHLKSRGRNAVSVSWGLWNDVGLASGAGGREVQRRLGERGVNGFSVEDGVRALDALLNFDVSHVAVFNADRSLLAPVGTQASTLPLLHGFRTQPADKPIADAASGSFSNQVRSTDVAQRTLMLAERVGMHVASVLKLKHHRLDAQKPLGEYGMNSIMGLELRRQLERDLDLRLSATLVFNYPTVGAIAAHLATRLGAAETPHHADGDIVIASMSAPSGNGDTATAASVRVAEAEALSDDDALAALRSPRKGSRR